jgi:hypothetical protein
LNQLFCDPSQEERAGRFSSLSEHVEVLNPHNSTFHKQLALPRKKKQCSKFQQVGVPKCLQLVEAIQEGGLKARRQRHKDGEGTITAAKCKGGDDSNVRTERMEKGVADFTQSVSGHLSGTCTPTSDIVLISATGVSSVPETQIIAYDVDRSKVVEAAKLLKLQKKVGFTFEEHED